MGPQFKAVAPQAGKDSSQQENFMMTDQTVGRLRLMDGPSILVGKWSPKSPGSEDLWRDDAQPPQRSGSVQPESQSLQGSVWTPRSAQCSPVASRKQYRPVQFQSPVMERKFTNVTDATGDDALPPWEQPGFAKLPPPVHQHGQTQPQSSVRRLAQSFSAPKLNAGVVDGHSEAYSKHCRNYVCPPTRSLFEGNRHRISLIIEIYYV